MSDKRAVLNAERAINALPDRPTLTAFLLIEEQGRPKRLLDTYKKEMIVNLITSLGGVDVSGDDILQTGFGIGFPIDTPEGSRWFFVETRPDFCPFCQGEKFVRNEVDFEIISEICWVCGGVGRVLTKEIPRRKKEEVLGG